VTHPDVVIEHLFDEDRILIAPAGHLLAARDRVCLVDLAEHELLLEPSGTAFRDELDREATAAGVELRAKAEVDGLRLIATLAFEGFGAAIVPATAAPAWLKGSWRRVPIDGLEPRSVGLARRQRGLLSAPARALREAVTAVVASHGESFAGVHRAET
jgi:LysR family hydrogen peroxide-inducible transcriptional activator